MAGECSQTLLYSAAAGLPTGISCVWQTTCSRCRGHLHEDDADAVLFPLLPSHSIFDISMDVLPWYSASMSLSLAHHDPPGLIRSRRLAMGIQPFTRCRSG